MLIVKMMVEDPKVHIEDGNPRKRFRLITGVVDVRFDIDDAEQWCAYVWYSEEADPKQKLCDIFALSGNVYIMNENGRTISTFCPFDGTEPYLTAPKSAT